MSMVIADPQVLAMAAAEMQALNASVWAENVAAAAPTTGVVPAAADVVSILTAAQFASHARLYQEISARAASIREQLAITLDISAGSYAATEAANATAVA
ncbi:PE family protein [Mycobacterium sp. 852002-51163_SCH5372311]|uniref:PE family protein n=1 Tax=Mycobacterium sp. 852002-51163_SCH5372311 TaxID=1834097 RepID=UPI0007FDAC8B|nr:PE family protein [Mycobacterium sp. 852002-51163_SCH5372311]OBF86103.1 PE family protein [Mycobacterium sp. 852002-51163_SCH5372311]